MDMNELETFCRVLGVLPERVVEDASRTVLAAEQTAASGRPAAHYGTCVNYNLAASRDRGPAADADEAN